MSFRSLLIDRCSISRYHDNVKRGNFTKHTLVEISSDIHCRATLKSTTNTDTNGRTKVISTYILRLPRNTDIKNGDVVTLNGREGRWTAGEPFDPSRHHIKVVLQREGEV